MKGIQFCAGFGRRITQSGERILCFGAPPTDRAREISGDPKANASARARHDNPAPNFPRCIPVAARLLPVILGAAAVALGGCAESTPQLNGLDCELSAKDDGYSGFFELQFVDSDSDLDEENGHLQWWVDEIAQTDISLDASDPDSGAYPLGQTGTIALEFSTFPAYEEIIVRFQVVDSAGNESNEIAADMNTDPEILTCKQRVDAE